MVTPENTLHGLWLFWMGAWFLAAFWRARSVKHARGAAHIGTILIASVGFAFMFGANFKTTANPYQFWVPNETWRWIFVCVAAVGFAFMGWARLHLGRNWSGGVVLKEGHRVVDTGPYAIVRHPIYTGVIVAALATAAVKGNWLALFGAALIATGFWLKSRQEEVFLRAELGAAYDDYARKVPALLPFGI